MLNYIWGGMILISLIVSLFTGKIDETAASAVGGATQAVELCISLLGIMCLWTGLAKIGERAGLISIFARILKSPINFLFPKLKGNPNARGSIIMNIVANLFGMGNAATPLGLKAMNDLNVINKKRSIASDEMCMFVVLNTASIQLIPTTLISLRQAYGSSAPGEIIVPIWISSVCALAVGITVAKFLERRKRL